MDKLKKLEREVKQLKKQVKHKKHPRKSGKKYFGMRAEHGVHDSDVGLFSRKRKIRLI